MLDSLQDYGRQRGTWHAVDSGLLQISVKSAELAFLVYVFILAKNDCHPTSSLTQEEKGKREEALE